MEAILGRRSVRLFRPGLVSDAMVKSLLEAAMAAPSASAADPWRFIVLRDRTTLAQIADALPYGKMMAEAALGVIVCGDLEAAHDRQISYLLQDCAAATQNLLLAAHILGLGACWLGVHPREDRVRRLSDLLGLGPKIVPVAAVAVGWAGEAKEPRTRYNPAFVHLERW